MLGGKFMLECEFVIAEVKSNLFSVSLIGTIIQDSSSRERRDWFNNDNNDE